MRKPPFYKSFLNSISGVFWMLKSERNFQLEILGLILNLFLIVFLKLNATDTALILIVSFAVLSLEILNTAAEKICDVVQPEFDERIKIIKDISAGAVVLMSFAAICTGILVYWKYIF
ncbi:diacylglycerol kinase family protein [Kaistella jeonii]|uniref:Diacylglycerol kinase n=1 Tax=Kaistella jeonii TaxID=266749 RepID=A0A0C1FBS5_9FLAO|nr:diacylglycerol kinase family protein [Kaistella jeonii]KIA90537.1 diacylglycerol kinase [Kaistella jeonii]SFB71272.1 diacylglycerol kinase (ATP) [Kaistella jeonii]VEI94876.1 Undecaprenol kinase [Kaistella jeonii]